MRVKRQHNEHIVLASAQTGVGRYQCIRLASFALLGQVCNFKAYNLTIYCLVKKKYYRFFMFFLI